ncbi:GIY-YIG nuclease family protein [Clostridium perfringens]|uniref:GIY-YIG nuclease family protein n=1 Tax=Clostridium perfringens TaxID=1502 RepID=UPI0030CEE7C5|nr:GIY-YIG nuclease family protein [Clostridium perfringens]
MLTLYDIKEGTKEINYNYSGAYVIYKITNIFTLNFYIGKSINIKKRLKNHVIGLENNKNNKNFLYEFEVCKKDLSLYKFEILVETWKKEELDRLEKYYISEYSDKVLFNILHNNSSVNFEKEYPNEACWLDMLETGYKSMLTYYANWYRTFSLREDLRFKNEFAVILKEGEKLINHEFAKNENLVRLLFSSRSGLLKLQIDHISISLICTLIKRRPFVLIMKIVDVNMHKKCVRKIIANAYKFTVKISNIEDLDNFLDWLLEILNDDELRNMTLLDFSSYYATYLYTQKFLIK